MAFFFYFIFLLVSFASACDRCVHQTKAAYFSGDAALSSGACGYGSLALEFSGGRLAAAVPSLYKNGAGCGACFQIRCKSSSLCSKSGVRVVLSDLNTHNETDFVLSRSAFEAMAQKGSGQQLVKLGIVDVEYKRVPCEYKNKNLTVRVEESSEKPYYLALKFLYQGGQTEIVGVDVAQVETSKWRFMSRNHGAVWDTSRVGGGAMQMRIEVTSGFDGKWMWAKKVLPADWKRGQVYDTALQITDIAQEPCSPCDNGSWSSST